jgi:hypothetical protein
MKKSALIAIIISLFFISISFSFAAEPVPSATTEEAVVEVVAESAEAISPPATVADLEKVRASMKVETDWLSIREKRTRDDITKAIRNSQRNITEGVNTVAKNVTTVTQRIANDASAAADSAQLAANAAKALYKESKEREHLTRTAVDGVKTEIQKIGSSVEKTAQKSTLIILGVIIALGMGLLGWLVIRKQEETRSDVIRELRAGQITKDIAEIKGVVKPSSFTLRFTATGEDYTYDVPVNNRGKFVSIYAPKVTDPADMPATPAETARVTFDDERNLVKSCKSAIKKYATPNCDQVQKDLIDHLLSTGELRKA